MATSIVDYERGWVEGLNRGDVSAADDAFARDCVVHVTGAAEPIRGVDAWKEVVAGLLAGFPDLHFTIDDRIASGDKVAMRWHARGTHRGPFGGVAATGRRVSIEGVLFDHVVDGKVVERWEQWDLAALMQQIGAQ